MIRPSGYTINDLQRLIAAEPPEEQDRFRLMDTMELLDFFRRRQIQERKAFNRERYKNYLTQYESDLVSEGFDEDLLQMGEILRIEDQVSNSDDNTIDDALNHYYIESIYENYSPAIKRGLLKFTLYLNHRQGLRNLVLAFGKEYNMMNLLFGYLFNDDLGIGQKISKSEILCLYLRYNDTGYRRKEMEPRSVDFKVTSADFGLWLDGFLELLLVFDIIDTRQEGIQLLRGVDHFTMSYALRRAWSLLIVIAPATFRNYTWFQITTYDNLVNMDTKTMIYSYAVLILSNLKNTLKSLPIRIIHYLLKEEDYHRYTKKIEKRVRPNIIGNHVFVHKFEHFWPYYIGEIFVSNVDADSFQTHKAISELIFGYLQGIKNNNNVIKEVKLQCLFRGLFFEEARGERYFTTTIGISPQSLNILLNRRVSDDIWGFVKKSVDEISLKHMISEGGKYSDAIDLSHYHLIKMNIFIETAVHHSIDLKNLPVFEFHPHCRSVPGIMKHLCFHQPVLDYYLCLFEVYYFIVNYEEVISKWRKFNIEMKRNILLSAWEESNRLFQNVSIESCEEIFMLILKEKMNTHVNYVNWHRMDFNIKNEEPCDYYEYNSQSKFTVVYFKQHAYACLTERIDPYIQKFFIEYHTDLAEKTMAAYTEETKLLVAKPLKRTKPYNYANEVGVTDWAWDVETYVDYQNSDIKDPWLEVIDDDPNHDSDDLNIEDNEVEKFLIHDSGLKIKKRPGVVRRGKHVVYLIYVINVHKVEENYFFTGDNCIREFVNWIESKMVLDQINKKSNQKIPWVNLWSFNGSNFDMMFLLNELFARFNPEMVGSCSSVKSMTVHNIKFVDFYKLYPVGSLEKQAQSWKVEFQKGKFDHNKMHAANIEEHLEEAKAYCLDDCRALAGLILKHMEFCREIGAQYTASGISGLVLKYYLSTYIPEYWEDKPKCLKSENDIELPANEKTPFMIEPLPYWLDQIFREGFRGGITLLFIPRGPHPSTPNKKLSYWDINSSYPASMLKNDMPVKLNGYVKKKIFLQDLKDNKIELNDCYYYVIKKYRFKPNILYPMFPEMDDHGMIWYKLENDRDHHVWGNELMLCLKYDVLEYLELEGWYDFERKNIFADFITEMYEKRLAASKNNDDVKKCAFKLWMNSLYGKLGQKVYPSKIFCNQERFQHLLNIVNAPGPLSNQTKIVDIEILTSVIRCITVGDIDYKRAGFPFIPSKITSSSRCNLMEVIYEITDGGKVPNVYYVDTDSIVSSVDIPEKYKHETELGKWKKEGTVLEFIGCGAKFYYMKLEEIDKETKKPIEIKKCKGAKAGLLEREDFINFQKTNYLSIEMPDVFDKNKSGIVYKADKFKQFYHCLRRREGSTLYDITTPYSNGLEIPRVKKELKIIEVSEDSTCDESCDSKLLDHTLNNTFSDIKSVNSNDEIISEICYIK